jgi:hypothetical protein
VLDGFKGTMAKIVDANHATRSISSMEIDTLKTRTAAQLERRRGVEAAVPEWALSAR